MNTIDETEDTQEVRRSLRDVLVYVAGPFRSKPNSNGGVYSHWEQEQNIRKAENIALELWRNGFTAFCPHTMTRFYQGAAEDDVWLKGDLVILKRCDAIVFCSGWEQSIGSNVEYDFSTKNAIPKFYVDLNMSWIPTITTHFQALGYV